MTEPLSLMYGIDQQTRCLVGIQAEQERTLFLVGTLSLKQDNMLCMLEVDDEWLQISKKSFVHRVGEVWHLASHPTDPSMVATCYFNWAGKVECGAAIWKISSENTSMDQLAKYECNGNSRTCSSFEFSSEGNTAGIAVDKNLLIADVEMGLKTTASFPVCSKGNINAMSWNPHSGGSIVSLANGSSVKGIDTRSSDVSFCIENANPPTVRNLDYNPNVQYTLATCGDDCKVSLWDTRNTKEALKTLLDHAHWVWSVRFNPIHDQLLLSVGSDARLFLNNIESLCSEYIHALDFSNDDSDISDHKTRLDDGQLEKVEEHEDSIYCCAWAGNDPWVFASLSYDGRVIVSRVKRHHKYAILRL